MGTITPLKNPATRNQKLMNINDQTLKSDFEIANFKSIIFTIHFANYNFTKQYLVAGTRTYTLVECLTRILFGQTALLFGNSNLTLLRTQHKRLGISKVTKMNE